MYKRSNPMRVNDRILEEIDSLRVDQGLTFKELESKAGISSGMISNWMYGACNPSVRSLVKVCNGLGISMLELFARVEGISLTNEQIELLKVTSKMSPEEIESVTHQLKSIDR